VTAEAGPEAGGTERLLRELVDLVENARSLPMSTSVRIERDEVLALLDDALAQLPEELRAARHLLKEREEFLARTRREAAEILADAKARVAQMVQRAEVVKAADKRAREILEDAEAEARRMRHDAEDYCDQKLASFEVVLERIGRTVAQGRQRLAATVEEIELGTGDHDVVKPGR
jgi:cell division septum initiation protein DivIVA